MPTWTHRLIWVAVLLATAIIAFAAIKLASELDERYLSDPAPTKVVK